MKNNTIIGQRKNQTQAAHLNNNASDFLANCRPEMYEEKRRKLEALADTFLFTRPPQSSEEAKGFGWLRGQALESETILQGRWYAWLKIVEKAEITERDEIPEVSFSPCSTATNVVRKMLDQCLSIVRNDGHQLDDFIEWIGYSLGISWFKEPKLSDKCFKKLYETFNIDLFWLYPQDYLSCWIAENGKSGTLDYFPTPHSVVQAINRMIVIDNDPFQSKVTSCFEPCLGAASMVLPSKSLNIIGTDLNPTMVKVASIQAFLYLPWLLYTPHPIINMHYDKERMAVSRYFEFKTDTRIYCGDSLLGEFTAPKHIFMKESESVHVYIDALDLQKRDIFKYEKEFEQALSKDWNTLDKEVKFKIVAAQARELGFNHIVTNPPFNIKMGKWYKEQLKEIEERNQKFLKERKTRRMKINKKTPIQQQVDLRLKGIEKDVETKIIVIKERTKQSSKGQLAFDW